MSTVAGDAPFWSRHIFAGFFAQAGRLSLRGDNLAMLFRAESEVIVNDSPHVPNQGRDRQKDFNTQDGGNLTKASFFLRLMGFRCLW